MNVTLTYTAILAVPKTNCFEVTFNYEHGDADEQTTCVQTYFCSEDEFKRLLEKFEEVANAIEQSRQTGKALPSNFESLARVENLWIPLELDCFAKMHMSGYYAAMSIDKIIYHNEKGVKFITQYTVN